MMKIGDGEKEELLIKIGLEILIIVKETKRPPRRPTTYIYTASNSQYTKDLQYTEDTGSKIQDSCAAATLLRLSYSSRLMCMHTQQLHPI